MERREEQPRRTEPHCVEWRGRGRETTLGVVSYQPDPMTRHVQDIACREYNYSTTPCKTGTHQVAKGGAPGSPAPCVWPPAMVARV